LFRVVNDFYLHNRYDNVTTRKHIFILICFQACRILLSYGCDTTIVSLQGYTAAQLATESVAKILAEEPVHQAGADIEYQLLEAAKAGIIIDDDCSNFI
jgi:hypothetical protein